MRKRLFSIPEALHFPGTMKQAGLLRRPAPESEALLKLAALAGSPIERRRTSRSIGTA